MENELAANASVEAPGPEQPLDGIDNIDITESLSSDQIQNLFDACDASDWSEVDRLIDSFEKQGIYPDSKAGGADRNSGNAEKLRRYWTTGPGGAKIGWGASGDWTRCVSHLSKYLGPRAKGYCALRHKEMNGFYPGDNANKSDSPNNMAGFSTYHETKQPGELGEPMLEHKTVGVKGMNVVSAEAGIVETIISVTGVVDNVKDRIMPGAYEKTLAKRKPKGVWSHDWDTPVSKTLSVKELLPGDKELPRRMPNGDPWPAGAGALKVKTQFNLDTQRGREAYSDVTFFGDEQEWCVDPETEILTDRGWLRYDEVAVGDQAYVLDPQYATGRFEPISAVNVFPVKERTVRSIQIGGFSSVTTSAHRWPVADNSNGGHVRWTTTAALDYRDRIIRSAPRMDAPATPKYADAFVETVGWFWNEGWVPPADHPDAGLYIAQSTAVNPQHVASIRAALDAAFPGRWSEAHAQDDMARFRLKRDAADAVLAVTGAAKEPTPEFLASLTRSQLRLLIDVCMSGDGHATKSGQWTWYQVADAGVGAFQMLCALAGVPTNATPQKDYGNRYGRPPTRVSLLRSGVAKPIDAIRVKGYGYKTGSPRTVAEDEWVQSTGVVWCPTTESGTWMARRRGTVYVTGNSIGYNVPVGGAQVDTKSGVREIGTLELYEYSPVLFGAMPLARTTSVKEAQLALKALKGGAASWLNTESAVATTAEYTAVSTDDDEADTIDLSGDDMLLVKTAIQTLTDLLNAVETETKGKFPFQKDEEDEETDDAALDEETEDPNAEEEESDVEEEPEEEVLDDNGEVIEPEADTAELGDDPGVGTDPKARLDAALAEAAQNPPEEGMWGSDNPPPEDGNEFYTSMAEAVDDLIDDAVLRNELIAIADEIDTAMDEEDTAYFEEAVRLALDKIEENLGADDEADLKELAEIIADSIEQMGIDVPQEEVDQATETGDYATDPFAEEGAEDVDPNAEVEVDPDAETAPDEDPVLDEEDPALTASDVEAPEEDMPEDPEAVEESSDDEEDDKKKKGKFPFAKAGKSVINVSEYKSLLDELRND